MGEERIRIESYDMPEGKCSHTPLSETPYLLTSPCTLPKLYPL